MAKLDSIFRLAVEQGASDIYISVWAVLALRINGEIIYFPQTIEAKNGVITSKLAEELLFEIMNADQKAKFQENLDLDLSYFAPGIARFRGNFYWHKDGMAAVFRPIGENVKTLEELSLPPALNQTLNFNNGLVLITGAVWSGKSTTLAGIIEGVNRTQNKHIITIEDPIEFVYQNKKSIIEQREVRAHTLSFNNALKAALRENADIILIGEMRDLETIKLAITAAETGSLVLATLHTNGTAETINRLIDVFPSEQQGQIRSQISESLRAVIWQQLLKRQDVKGRIAAMEILFKNTAVSNLIRQDNINQIKSVIETNIDQGMQTMTMHLKMLVHNGIISPEEAFAKMPKEKEMD